MEITFYELKKNINTNLNEFNKKNIFFNIKQINHSLNLKKGTLRGLHFTDLRKKEIKIVQCIMGRVCDVIFDLRKSSITHRKFLKIELNESNQNLLIIPSGVAHGFQTLTHNTLITYYTNIYFNKKFDRGINPLDPDIGINWPIKNRIISKRDKNLPMHKNF